MKNYKKILPILLFSVFLTGSIIYIYLPTIQYGFMTGWDDQWQVLNNQTEGGITISNLKQIFTSVVMHQYSPLNQCLYSVIYQIDGYNPTYFHGICIIIHLMNSYLVFIFIYILAKDHIHLSTMNLQLLAFLVALFFGIHPMQVESVAWISASKILTSSFFYLLATICYILFLKEGKKRYLGGTIILFISSLLCKEQAVIFPLWQSILWLIYKQKNIFRKEFFIQILPFLIISLIWGLIYLTYISGYHKNASEVQYTWNQRIIFTIYSFTEYIVKWIIPYKQLYLYPYPISQQESFPLWLLGYPTAIVLIIWCFNSWFQKKIVVFTLTSIIIHLILVLHIIPLSRYAIIADRYIYLPSIGITFLMFYYILNTINRLSKQKKFLGWGCIIFIYIIVVFLASKRIEVWYSTITLKQEIKELYNQNL